MFKILIMQTNMAPILMAILEKIKPTHNFIGIIDVKFGVLFWTMNTALTMELLLVLFAFGLRDKHMFMTNSTKQILIFLSLEDLPKYFARPYLKFCDPALHSFSNGNLLMKSIIWCSHSSGTQDSTYPREGISCCGALKSLYGVAVLWKYTQNCP